MRKIPPKWRTVSVGLSPPIFFEKKHNVLKKSVASGAYFKSLSSKMFFFSLMFFSSAWLFRCNGGPIKQV